MTKRLSTFALYIHGFGYVVILVPAWHVIFPSTNLPFFVYSDSKDVIHASSYGLACVSYSVENLSMSSVNFELCRFHRGVVFGLCTSLQKQETVYQVADQGGSYHKSAFTVAYNATELFTWKCTAVVVSLGILPYVEWLHTLKKMYPTILCQEGQLTLLGVSCERLRTYYIDIQTGRSMADGMPLP